MRHVITRAEFSFGAIVSILTGKVFADKELEKLARFLAKDSIGQVMADRQTKWIPWLLVQFPDLEKINYRGIEEDPMLWFKRQSEVYGGQFLVSAVHYC